MTAIEALEESEFVEAIDYRIFYEMKKKSVWNNNHNRCCLRLLTWGAEFRVKIRVPHEAFSAMVQPHES